MKTLLAAFLLVSLPAAAQSTAEADAKLSAALQRIHARKHVSPVYAPRTQEPSILQTSARINPTMTAQKYMRTVYQPTDDDQCLAEMRRARSQAESARFMAEQRAHQERIIMQQRLDQLERARQLERQYRSIESITGRPVLGR